jgi:PKD repeat protein
MRIAPTAFAALLLVVSAAPMLGAMGGSGDLGAGRAPEPRFTSVTFANVSSSAGLSGLNANFLAWGDYNNDGCQDLLIQGSLLFRNNGPPSWDFTDVTSAAGLSGGFNSGTWADFNNDGWLDFYAAGGTDRLYKNDGDGTFTDVTVAAGNVQDAYPSTAAGWGDYDRDGFVDLYVANGEDWNGGNPLYYPDILWHNDGDGTFTDATSGANMSEGNHPYYGRGVEWADFNNDGWLDLYVSNYRLSPNYLYVNDHDGTFTELGKQLDCAGVYDPDRYEDATAASYYGQRYWGPKYGHTIGSAWADFNNDGNFDLWTTNLAHKYVGLTGDPIMPYDIRGYVCDDSKMYRNAGAPTYNFTDIRAACGIPTKPIGGSGVYQGDELFDGVAWGDMENDGDLDLWIPQVYDLNYAYSYLYEQDGAGNGSMHWTDRASALGMRVYDTYAGVWCDYDNDGDLDLLTAGKAPFVASGQGSYQLHLFRNNGNANSWLDVRLTGTDCNRAAIGARVTVKAGNLTQLRQVEGGMGCHGSQNSMVQHFGFNDRSAVDWVEVEWPCGRIERFTGVALGRVLNVTESSLPVPVVSSASAAPSPADEDAWVQFSAAASVTGGSIANWQWDFSSDNTYEWSNTANGNAAITYADNGTYNARLRVWSDKGIGAKYGPVIVTVRNLPPVADAGADRTVDMDSSVVFNGSDSNDTETDMHRGLLYRWDFGDGAFRNWSKAPEANHTYDRPGKFQVLLSVRDDDRAEDAASVNVTVTDVPPSAGAMADRKAMEDETIQFTGTGNDTPTDRPKLQYRWDFGDGNATGYAVSASASHAYSQKGNYTATLSVRDQYSAVTTAAVNITVLNPAPACEIMAEFLDRTFVEDRSVVFDGTGSDNPSDMATLVFRWDFGDGNMTDWSPATPASHTYTTAGAFNVTMTVRDDDGDTGTVSARVRINNILPAAEILMDDQTVNEDQTVDLEGAGTDSASDQDILVYQWIFGDGSRSDWLTSPETTHSYPVAGRYKVTLAVRDDEGATGASEPVFINVENAAPVASASASSKNVDEDQPVAFTAKASHDTPSDLSTLRYSWDFGDKSDEEEGMNASHSYARSGTYTVRLTVTDNDGASSVDSTLRIKVANLAPTATASADTLAAKVGQAIRFNGGGNDTPSDLPQLKYDWSFGDNTVGTGKQASHAFTAAGRYTVTLSVYDPEGEKGTATVTVDISPAKKAEPPAAGPNWALIGAGIAAAVVAIIAALIAVKRKAR